MIFHDLHKAAKIIVDQYNNQFPVSEQQLSKLPGLGTYTDRALLVFAFGKNIAAVDTNIRQIITHLFFDDKPQKESIIQNVAEQLLPKGKSWEWHQALMDYGAIALKSRATCLPARQESRDLSKKSIPFKETNRYFRGKIMDILRKGPIDEHILLQDYSAFTINGLIQDGLVERRKGILRLPD